MDFVFNMYLWEEINTKFQMYPYHPPRSSAALKFLASWMSMSYLGGCSLQWISESHHSTVSYDASWHVPSCIVMISGFISIGEEGLVSNFNPWFKLHSRPISHLFIHSSIQVHYLNFHFFDVLNDAAGPSLWWVVLELRPCLKYSRRGSDFSYCPYLFIYLFFSHGSALF